jgi:cytochrome c-type biogenesis protein CcmE
MEKRTKIIIGVFIVIVSLVGLVMRMKSSISPYITVSELKSGNYAEEYVRVNGSVAPGSIEWHPKEILLSFRLTDNSSVVDVEYRGSRPNNFEDGRPVVVGGVYEGSIFKADEILVKCPSKYTKEVK